MNIIVAKMAFFVKMVLALLTAFGGGPRVNEFSKSSCCLLYKAYSTLLYKTENNNDISQS